MKEFNLNARLMENPLAKEEPKGYVPHIEYVGSIGIRDIAVEIKNEGSELSVDTIEDILKRGEYTRNRFVFSQYIVNTGYSTWRAVATGVTHDGLWNPDVNTIHCVVTQGQKTVEDFVNKTSVTITHVQDDVIAILEAVNAVTGKADGTMTRGRILKVKGRHLRIAGDDPTVALSLVNQDSSKETKIPFDMISTNDMTLVEFIVPIDLADGTYRVKIVTQVAQGHLTGKKIHIAESHGTLKSVG
jgi:hypothetical protein